MSRSRMIHECLRRDSRVVLPRVGGGVGGGDGVHVIHASRLTRPTSLPVDNATAVLTSDRLGWMAADAAGIGGGR